MKLFLTINIPSDDLSIKVYQHNAKILNQLKTFVRDCFCFDILIKLQEDEKKFLIMELQNYK